MAEYYDGEVEAPDAVAGSDDLEVDGYYFQAGYILTGESRKYKTGSAAFDKVKPGKDGAWEIFARYDEMNADMGNNINLVGGEAQK
ncbi:Phosphate-specific outer membrane porin OprP Pyrophosphate-specific outer membrane porin OprO [gamma proteobacterium IMCC2047]|nr:Phosphate-specific outer membrane porin OprP Pyrophosphate-specific outer membrane porin OprO [gamma proteobacterium IMCC2047]